MSILETFYILFKGDSADVKKAAKESEHAVQNLSDALTGTFRKVDTATTRVNRSFYELAKAAAAFVGATTAAYTVFHKTLEASQYVGDLANISRALGVNAADLDAWGQAVQRTGGNAVSFQSSLRSLSQHFGVSAGLAIKMLPQLADAFKRLGNYRSQYYGKILGLDEATILLLQQGRREVESIIKQIKELSTVTEKDIEISNKNKIAQLQLSLAFRSLYLSLAQEVIPVLTKMYNNLVPIVEYIKDHKDLVIGAFIGIGIAAALMLAPFVIANAAIIGTGIAIATLIGLFAIAYEDIKAYVEGNQSLTGDLIKRWTDVKNLFNDVLNIIKKILSYTSIPGLGAAISLVQGGIARFNAVGANITTGASNFFNDQFTRNAQINIGDIIVNTQATDAVGVSNSIREEFLKQLSQAANNFSNGASM